METSILVLLPHRPRCSLPSSRSTRVARPTPQRCSVGAALRRPAPEFGSRSANLGVFWVDLLVSNQKKIANLEKVWDLQFKKMTSLSQKRKLIVSAWYWTIKNGEQLKKTMQTSVKSISETCGIPNTSASHIAYTSSCNLTSWGNGVSRLVQLVMLSMLGKACLGTVILILPSGTEEYNAGMQLWLIVMDYDSI